ncbi:MAG TPA: GxxExxY protein [Verrucomicrobiota bacterium]|nr:GxxExxY protein [Verrucomicrobiota bacterium]HQK00552.1 GxxExxY protein [Verrucomicrobiota bacterium]
MPLQFNETQLNQISYRVIGLAMQVHRELGPGLLESAYEECLVYELRAAGFVIDQQKPCPVRYRGVVLECGYRIDIVVADALIVEVKSVQELLPVHRAQILTYMKLDQKPLGLLINFNVPLLKDGIERLIVGPLVQAGLTGSSVAPALH